MMDRHIARLARLTSDSALGSQRKIANPRNALGNVSGTARAKTGLRFMLLGATERDPTNLTRSPRSYINAVIKNP